MEKENAKNTNENVEVTEEKVEVGVDTVEEPTEELIEESVDKLDVNLPSKMDSYIKALKNKKFHMEEFGINEWLNVYDLKIDEDTQRGIMVSQVERVIREFNPMSFGRVTVSKRKDGYYVTNGQHRVVACKKIGIEKIPCIVIKNEHEDVSEQKKQDAINFLEINQNSQAVKAIDKYRLGVSAQKQEWLNVKQVLEENGLRAGTTLNSVNCIACIYRYINGSKNQDTVKSKKKQISRAIKILNETVGVTGITHISLQAMCIIVREYVDTGLTTVDKLISRFNKLELSRLLSVAITLKNAGTKKNVVSYLAFLLVEEYNNKCKNKKDELPLDRVGS